MLNGNTAGGQNLAGTGGMTVSTGSGVSIGGHPIIPPVMPSSSGLNKSANSGLQKVVVSKPSTTTTTTIDPAFAASHAKPGKGDMWISKDDYGKLSATEKATYDSTGYDGLTLYWAAQNGNYAANIQAYQAQRAAYYASDTVKTAQQRITDLQQEATNADQLAANGTLNGVYYGDDPAHHSMSPDQKAAYQAEAAKARATAQILRSYIEAGAPIPPELSAISDPKILPFVSVNSDGTFNIDTVGAAKVGIDPKLLKSVGASDTDIAQGQTQHRLIKYAIVGGGFDLNRAVNDNVSTTDLHSLGFTDSDISNSKAYNAVMTVLNKGYKQDNGYLVSQAVVDGKITLAQAQSAGFSITNADVNNTKTVNSTMAKLNKSYKSADGYQVLQAIDDGVITLAQAQAAGFSVTDADVRQSKQPQTSTTITTYTDANGTNREHYDSGYKPPSPNAEITAIETKPDGVHLSVDSILGKNKNYTITRTLMNNAKANLEDFAINVVTVESNIVKPGYVSGIVSKLGNNAKNNLSDLWDGIVHAAVSYNAAHHSGTQTIQPDVKPATFTQEATAIKQAAGKAWSGIVNTAVAYNAAHHSGIRTYQTGVKPATFAQEATAVKDAAGDAWDGIVHAAVSYNAAHHSGTRTYQAGVKPTTIAKGTKAGGNTTDILPIPETISTEPDLRSTWSSMADTYRNLAKAQKTNINPSKESIIGGVMSSNASTAIGLVNAFSGDTLTPALVIGILAMVGITYSQREQIQNAIDAYKIKQGRNPTASEIMVKDATGHEVTLDSILHSAKPSTLATITHVAKLTTSKSSVVNSLVQQPTKPNVETMPLHGALIPSIETMPAHNLQTPIESMPAHNLKAPSAETIPTHTVKVPSIETFPLGVEAPPHKVTDSKPVPEPTTEAGKKLQQEMLSANPPKGLTWDEAAKEKADVKALPDADLTPKTEAGKKLQVEVKTQQYAELNSLRDEAAQLEKTNAAIRAMERAVASADWKAYTPEGEAIKAEYKAQQAAESNSLRDAAAQLAKTQAAIRAMERAVASADWKAYTEAGKRIKAEYTAAKAAEVTAMREAAAQLAKTQAAIRAMERAVASADWKAYTPEGTAIKAEDLAAKAAQIKQLQESAATVAKFEELIQEIGRAQSTVDFTSMKENINRIKANEAKLHPDVNADKYDGGSWLIHGDDGSLLFSVMEGNIPAGELPKERTKVAEALEQMWSKEKPKRHWSEEDYVALEDVASDIGIRRLTHPAAITGKTIEELDRKVAEAYIKGELTNTQLSEYTTARSQIASETVSKAIAAQNSTSPSKETTPKGAYAVAVTAAILAAHNAVTKHKTAKQTTAAIKQAIYIHIGVQSPTVIREITRTAEQIVTQQLTKPAGKPNIRPANKPNIKPANKPNTKSETKPNTKPATREEPKEETKPQTQPMAKENVKPKSISIPKVRTRDINAEREKDNEKDKDLDLENDKFKMPTTSDQSTAQKEKRIQDNRGAVAWNQGALYGKRRWDILLYPYDQKSDHIILFSNKPPQGAKIVTGPGSAFATAQRLYGKTPNKDIMVSGTGFEQLEISPGGKSGITLHYTPITPRLHAHLTDHKPLPADHKRIDGNNAVFPLRRRQ